MLLLISEGIRSGNSGIFQMAQLSLEQLWPTTGCPKKNDTLNLGFFQRPAVRELKNDSWL